MSSRTLDRPLTGHLLGQNVGTSPAVKIALTTAAQVVRDALGEHLVDLGDRQPRPNSGAELGLDHREHGLDVAPPVVVRQEPLLVEQELAEVACDHRHRVILIPVV